MEIFTGRVDAIYDDIAYLTLRSPQDEILWGEYSATELAKFGITVGRRFQCWATDQDVTFELLAERTLTDEDYAKIDELVNTMGDK